MVFAEDESGTGTMFTTRYRYESLRGSVERRGPQGFAKVTVIDDRPVNETDTTSKLVVETTFGQIYPYTGLPTSVTKSIAIGGLPPDGTLKQLTQTITSYCDSLAEDA